MGPAEARQLQATTALVAVRPQAAEGGALVSTVVEGRATAQEDLNDPPGWGVVTQELASRSPSVRVPQVGCWGMSPCMADHSEGVVSRPAMAQARAMSSSVSMS